MKKIILIFTVLINSFLYSQENDKEIFLNECTLGKVSGHYTTSKNTTVMFSNSRNIWSLKKNSLVKSGKLDNSSCLALSKMILEKMY